MPEYLTPGVYIEEVDTGPVPIEGVSTSVTGFVGQTERGPLHPQLVTSWLEYQRWYGTYIAENDPLFSYLPYAVKGFFDNSGQMAYIARVAPPGAAVASLNLATAGAATLDLTAIGPGSWGTNLFVRVETGTRSGFKLTFVYYRITPPLPAGGLVDPLDPATIRNPNRRDPDAVEVFDNLGFDPEGLNYVLTMVRGASHLIGAAWGGAAGAAGPPVPALPNNIAFTQMQVPPGAPAAPPGARITAAEYTGQPAPPAVSDWTGLAGLEAIDGISILCVPDEVLGSVAAADQAAIQEAVVDQCERLKDRFAILQIAEGQGDVTQIVQGQLNFDTSYAAIYYPWIRVLDPLTDDTLLIPSGGHIAGIYARTDDERGVHKAPANTDVRGIIASDLPGNRGPLEYKVTDGQQAILNPRGVNVIRDFRSHGRGILVWGARTMSSNGQWKYVNVRRLFIFVEQSIERGTQWVVFEPNDEPTWDRVTRSVTNFLLTVWRSGALMGTTQEEAFFVKCDRTTMSQDDIDNGRLICIIGIAPVKPAEFVIFRISQKTIEATT
jgi:phage tail sheath protein FI